ncbi:hypothetical protein Bca101_057696 [Brassica carinata]
MGTSSKVYPNYRKIMAANLGDAIFSPITDAGGTNSMVADVSIDPASASVTVDPDVEENIDVPPLKKKRKRTKSSKKVGADPTLDGDEKEVARLSARSAHEPRDDDEIEDDREDIHIENSTSLAGRTSLGGGAHESSETVRQIAGGTPTIGDLRTCIPALARADAEAAACKNILVMEYETALRKAALDLKKAEETIKIKEAELETIKKRSSMEQKEEKLLLHGMALGTLDALRFLERKGLAVPRELKDLLAANEATFKKEAEEILVEVIRERDLALSSPRPASAVAPRSPIFGIMAHIVAQISDVAHQSTTATPENREGALDRPFGTVSGPSHRDTLTEDREARVADLEETETAATRNASLSASMLRTVIAPTFRLNDLLSLKCFFRSCGLIARLDEIASFNRLLGDFCREELLVGVRFVENMPWNSSTTSLELCREHVLISSENKSSALSGRASGRFKVFRRETKTAKSYCWGVEKMLEKLLNLTSLSLIVFRPDSCDHTRQAIIEGFDNASSSLVTTLMKMNPWSLNSQSVLVEVLKLMEFESIAEELSKMPCLCRDRRSDLDRAMCSYSGRSKVTHKRSRSAFYFRRLAAFHALGIGSPIDISNRYTPGLTTSGAGVTHPSPVLDGDGAPREKTGAAQVHDIEYSDSKLEPEQEAPNGAAAARPSSKAYLEQMFAEKFDVIQSLVERLPGVAPPIRKSNPNSYAASPFADEITLI